MENDIIRRMQVEIDTASTKLIAAEAENRRLTAVIESHAVVGAPGSGADIRCAALAVLKFRDGELPTRGWLRDNDASRTALHALAEAVSATPAKTQGSTPVDISAIADRFLIHGVLPDMPKHKRQMLEFADEVLAAAALAAPVVQTEPLIFDDYPEYSFQAMGCGLEDKGITNRYDAMRYGWDEAMERVGERISNFLSGLAAAPSVAVPVETEQQPDDSLFFPPKAMLNREDWDVATRKPKVTSSESSERAPTELNHGEKCASCDGKGGWVTAEWVDPVSGPECEGERCGDCDGTGIAPTKTAEGSIGDDPEFQRLAKQFHIAIGVTRRDALQALVAYIDTLLAASKSAPGKLTDEVMREAVAEGLRGLYGCGRSWSAWSVGTMSEDDFYPAEESDECITQVVDAIESALTTQPGEKA